MVLAHLSKDFSFSFILQVDAGVGILNTDANLKILCL